MEDPLSRAWLDGPLVTGWSGMQGEAAPCALPFGGFLGGLPRLLGAPPGADLGWHGPALGDDRLGLGRGDGPAVGVADDIGGAAAHDGPGPLGGAGGDDAQRARVVFAALGHLLVVGAGELGVLLAGGVGGADQGGAQQRGSGLGHGLALAVGLAGLRCPGGQAGEGAELLAGGEPGRSPMHATSAGPPTSAGPGSDRASPAGSTWR